ncbi:MAG: FeoA family protein [Thermodesulfobacteriota bacterium]|nr:FeoA family protein [Thermodesulfobacteriota bacterium]
MSLTMVSPGKRVKVVSLSGGRGMQERLISMGLGPGSEIEVMRRGAPGPFIVAVGETRLAVGAGMAQKIMVSDNGVF